MAIAFEIKQIEEFGLSVGDHIAIKEEFIGCSKEVKCVVTLTKPQENQKRFPNAHKELVVELELTIPATLEVLKAALIRAWSFMRLVEKKREERNVLLEFSGIPK